MFFPFLNYQEVFAKIILDINFIMAKYIIIIKKHLMILKNGQKSS